jgi:hypothetical protein
MTYSSRLRAKLDPKHPCNINFNQPKLHLPDEYYEKQYQQKLLAGFSKKRVCPTCKIALPATNICDYC